MGWLWGSSSSSGAQDKLDPSLREFLDKEAPTGPKPHLPAKPAAKGAAVASRAQDAQAESSSTPAGPAVPRESQFQDGRYAHLWKNYTPQAVLEERAKSDQDKLRDIVDAYNDRKADIGRVAQENCALEYMEQFNCFKNPSWVQAGTLCHAESKKFNRCYDMQTKFLKALGYLTMENRSRDEDERIQMHADTLYQRMLEQEAAMDKAREEGKPVPKFDSVLSKHNVARAMPRTPSPPTEASEPIQDHQVWSQIKPASRAEYERKLAELPEEDREIERQALLGELRAQTGIASKVEAAFVEERINRMKRREAGQATIGDTIKRLWGWG